MGIEEGVISNIEFGLGGYQGAMLGLTLTFDNELGSVQQFISFGWVHHPNGKGIDASHTKMGAERVVEILKKAKVSSISQLIGKKARLNFSGYECRGFEVMGDSQ